MLKIIKVSVGVFNQLPVIRYFVKNKPIKTLSLYRRNGYIYDT